jgi:hypothetical protein
MAILKSEHLNLAVENEGHQTSRKFQADSRSDVEFFRPRSVTKSQYRFGHGGDEPMTGQKKPGAAFWATVALAVVLMGYPLSFGPAIWLAARGYFRESAVQSFYMPILWSAAQAELLEDGLVWWGTLGVPDGECVTFMFETDDALNVFQFTRTGKGMHL